MRLLLPCILLILFILSGIPAKVLSAVPLVADDDHFQYLPADLKFDSAIPTPQQHLGFRIGERHLQHHQLVSYLRRLAELSPRVQLKTYAYTHGARPCILLTITSPDHWKKIESIRQAHLQLAQPSRSGEVDITNLPAVINMGYGVHGDESSASNAAAVVAYYLAAGQGEQVEGILENCIVLLDPCLNPDGFDRFASWANGFVGRVQNADPYHAEHNQPFPGGRVNYYWFDLNRDWLPAQHPESRGRLVQYHAWKPNVVLDFHEMGTNSTYFFQPGIPTRNNPLTPSKNYELTRQMADYHAQALDRLGSLYMTEERFDDFYMGKGSTYPDLHGSVGILFEQASSRGHRQESINGELTFPFTIRNQVTTSLTSLRATVDLRRELLEFKRQFYRDALQESQVSGFDHFEFRCPHDSSRLMAFADVLLRHDLQVYQRPTATGPVLIVPARQPEYRFLLSLTEKRTQFQENIFYDVSTWHLPSAFGVEVDRVPRPADPQELTRLTLKDLSPSKTGPEPVAPSSEADLQPAVAYAIDWRSSAAPQLVAELLRRDIQVRVAQQKFTIDLPDGPREFPHGTIMVPLGIQKEHAPLIQQLLDASPAPSYPITTGLTPRGIDLGSGEFAPVNPPHVALLIGSDVSRYEAGEVWHLFDTRLKHPLTLLETSTFSRSDLGRYSSLVLVSGSYGNLGGSDVDKIKAWVAQGGNLVLCGTACSWAKSRGLVEIELVNSNSATSGTPGNPSSSTQPPSPDPEPVLQKPFADARSDAALKLISGAIFDTRIDLTHPLGYGFVDDKLPVFRNNRVIIKPSSNPYVNAVVYTDSPQIAGYCSEENIRLLSRSAGALSATRGRGTVMVIPQNPNFRAFWHGTQRLFWNAVFFGDLADN